MVIERGGTDVPVVDAAVDVWLVLVVVRDPKADYADPYQAALLLGEPGEVAVPAERRGTEDKEEGTMHAVDEAKMNGDTDTLWYKQYVMNVLKVCDTHISFNEFVYYIL